MSSLDLPESYSRIQTVSSFEELLATPFENGINALCWERTLEGNFEEVAALLNVAEGINTIEDDHISSLILSDAGQIAVKILLNDQRLLREYGLEPILDCVNHYKRDVTDAPVQTDVFSFHSDSATVRADTYLCTYSGPPSEGLRNDQAQKCIQTPHLRAALLSHFGGADDVAFEEYLADYCFNLHYSPHPEARPFSFGVGNLWRIAIEYPGAPVPPCIHRAPATTPGQRRLLLIS